MALLNQLIPILEKLTSLFGLFFLITFFGGLIFILVRGIIPSIIKFFKER